MRPPHPPENIRQPIEQVTSHPWFERLARFGYVTKGIVYFIIGLLAAQLALGIGGGTVDNEGALQTIATQPFGIFLLAIVTIGMISYALWRFTQAALDPEHTHEETDAKNIAERLGYAFSGVVYTGLAFSAIKIITGAGTSGGDSTQDWTARVLAQPFGQWLVGLGGAVVIGVGLYYIYKALKRKFRGELKLQEMSPNERKWAIRVGQFGMTARGIVFAVIGIFLIQAAIHSNASEARGIGAALAALLEQPFGRWLLGFVAFGLIAYSVYCVVEARYRRTVGSS